MNNYIISEVIREYLKNDVDFVGVWWTDTTDSAIYSEVDIMTAFTLFADSAYLEKMSNGAWHIRIKAGAFRKAVYARKYRHLLRDKKHLTKKEFLALQKTWNNNRSRYGYNVGNFGEWFAATDVYELPDHFHHNTAPGADITTLDDLKIEVKTLIGCNPQIPIDIETCIEYGLN